MCNDVRKYRIGEMQTCVPALAWSRSFCVKLENSLGVSEPLCLHMKN